MVSVVDQCQKQMPLVEALERYDRHHPIRLHVPGHGGGRWLPQVMRGNDVFRWDVTELEQLDDLHCPRGVIAEAQTLAADLFGARETFFLVNGTTVGLQALIAACCGEGDGLVLPRNAHRSVLGGLILSGAHPVFVEPDVVPIFGVAACYGGDKLQRVLAARGDVTAVLAMHPCYYGVAGDLAGVADVCRRHNLPLLIDEAHGTHFRFHRDLPADGLSLGADAVVQSVHKTGAALTQASWLHLGTGRVDREKVAGALRLLQTSSPSYLLLASLDAARQQAAQYGENSWQYLWEQIALWRARLQRLPGLRLLDETVLGSGGAQAHDPTRLVLSVRPWGLSGHETGRRLARDYGVYVEMTDRDHVVSVLTPGFSSRDFSVLIRALKEIYGAKTPAGCIEDAAIPGALTAAPPWPPQRLTPRKAWLAPKRTMPLAQARGLVSGEVLAVHPPGNAIIYPGEEITPEVIEYLSQVGRWGLNCHGAADPALQTVLVVK